MVGFGIGAGGMRTLAAAAALSTLVIACGGSGGGSGGGNSGAARFDATIDIGADLALTGAQADRIQAELYGMKAAVAEINQGGGVSVGTKKYAFNLIVKDSRNDVTAATTNAVGLLQDSNVKFLFSPSTVPDMKAVSAVTSKVPALMMAAATSISAVGDAASPAFQYSFSPVLGGASAFAAWAAEAKTIHPEVKNVGLLMADDPANQALVGPVTNFFKGAGVNVVSTQSYPVNATDFSGPLTKLKAAKPDAVLFGFTSGVAGTILHQASQLGVAPLFMSNEDYKSATQGDRPQLDYLAVSPGAIYGPNATTKPRQDFGAQLQKLNGNAAAPPPDFTYIEAAGYVGIKAIAAAMAKTGSTTDVAAITQALTAVSVDVAGESYQLDAKSHQLAPTVDIDATLVKADGSVSTITFNPTGTSIVAQRKLS